MLFQRLQQVVVTVLLVYSLHLLRHCGRRERESERERREAAPIRATHSQLLALDALLSRVREIDGCTELTDCLKIWDYLRRGSERERDGERDNNPW